MVTHRRLFTEQGGFVRFVYVKNKYRITVIVDVERETASVTIRTAKGKEYRSKLERGCKLEDDWPLIG